MLTIIPPEGAGTTIRGHVQSEDFSFSASMASGELTAPVVQTVTIGGATTTITTTADSQTVPVFAVTNGPVEFSSATPGVCTVDQNGNVNALQSAECRIRLKGKTGVREWVGGVTRVNPVTTYSSNTAVEDSPVYTPPPSPPSPVPKQSLLSYLRDQHYAALTNVTPGSAAQRAHATANDPGFTANGGTVNTNNFLRAQAGSAQATAGFHPFQQEVLDEILVGGTTSTQWRAWITQHHYIGWRGHPSTDANGVNIYPSGSSWRHIAFELYVNYSATKWNGPLCKLLPPDVLKYLYMGASPYPDNRVPNPSTTIVNGVSIPIALTLMHCWARLYNTYDVGADKRWVMPVRFGNAQNPFDKAGLPQESGLRPYQKTNASSLMAQSGDSGSPVFLGINGTLVPVSQVSWAGVMGAVMYSNYITQINAAMNELSTANNDPDLATLGPYAVQTVDLSGFEKYYT